MTNTPRATNKVPLSAWLTQADIELLDEVVDALCRANRHLVTIAAVRVGLQVLRDRPEMVLDHIGDQRAAKHVRPRTP